MSVEAMLVLITAILGMLALLQGGVLFFFKVGLDKIGNICSQITELQKQMIGKVDYEEEHIRQEKVDVKLGKIGDRILKLELTVIPKITEELSKGG